jgi:hypothetical protein
MVPKLDERPILEKNPWSAWRKWFCFLLKLPFLRLSLSDGPASCLWAKYF